MNDVQVRRVCQIRNLVKRLPHITWDDINEELGVNMWDAPMMELDRVYNKLRKFRIQKRGCAV